MRAHEVVESWVEWCRQHLPPDRHISVIYSLGAPWEEHARLLHYSWDREKYWVFDQLAGIQAANPADLFARFPAVHYYRSLLASDPYPLHEDDAQQAREQARAELRTIVEFLKAEDCPCEWRALKFEILLAFLLKDWSRARMLFDRAESGDCLDRSVLQALRGQFHFLVALEGGGKEDVFADPVWEPRIFGSGGNGWNQSVHVSDEYPLIFVDALQEWGLFAKGTPQDLSSGQCVSDYRGHLRLAICNLENALEGPVALSSAYRSILARSCFEIGDDYLPKACAQYRQLLNADPLLPERLPHMSLSRGRYLFAARSSRRAGQIVEAQAVLDQWLAEDGNDVQALAELAELQAQEGHHDEAAVTLKRIVQLQPEREEDLGTRIALAVGGIPGRLDEQLLQEILAKQPEIPRLIDRICSTYWPPYVRLEESAKNGWMHGVFCLQHCAASWEDARLPFEVTAIAEFARAVEIQMRSCVFERFKKKVQQDTRLSEAAEAGRANPDTKRFCNYLLSEGHLQLGDMCGILGRSLQAQAGHLIYELFGLWLRETYPRIPGVIDSLRAIPQPRNLASHYGKRIRPASEIHDACRNVLEALVQRSSAT
jgi:tetratricopeptide (TPR) repeat protein